MALMAAFMALEVALQPIQPPTAAGTGAVGHIAAIYHTIRVTQGDERREGELVRLSPVQVCL